MKVYGSSLARWLVGTALGVVLGVSGVAFAGISATKHNLSSSGTGTNKTANTDQICVFCHTPHGSDTSAQVPLWNKVLSAPGSYAVYNSVPTSATSSLDGEIIAVGSVSIACLSCHDGTQAMDNVLNKPGSGGYVATVGSQIGGMPNAGIMQGVPVPRLGTDLTNDHPIGIEYCGGGLSGAGGSVSGSCNDKDFVGPSVRVDSKFANAVVKTKDINGSPVFWVETDSPTVSVNTTREKHDISLYTRAFTANANGPSVECGSCHDPHVESKGTDNIMFMRVTTAGSAICLSCHVK